MLEGWALFFQKVASQRLGTLDGINLESRPSTAEPNYDVPGNVAAYMWDVVDDSTNSTPRPPVDDTDGDQYTVYSESLEVRYDRMAKFFYGQPTNADFRKVWLENIEPRSSAQGTCPSHYAVTVRNSAAISPC